MKYNSTRNSGVSVSAAQAISRGISADGGLFVPESMPWLSYTDLKHFAELDYVSLAAELLGRFLEDYTREELQSCVSKAYTREKFGTESIAPLYMLEPKTYLLELWHGPTCAFKDMALQLLPQLLPLAVQKCGDDKTTVILVATSGDTGKAALEGFRDVPGTKILVFYPKEGVSPMQKLQMTTQPGANTYVCAIDGNFDAAQSGVKAIFGDEKFGARLAENGMAFSSANSINWGRLVPQIVYYVSAYADLMRNERITCGEKINVVVPTGNFGNILAAYCAKKMGIPIGKLICASNSNNVLTDFIKTGVYNRNRAFHTTISPSMDILISSNLERLLYDLSGCDDAKIRTWMAELAQTGRFEVDESVLTGLQDYFWGGFCDDAATRYTIRDIYRQYSYVCDPHTAVAVNVCRQYRAKTGDTSKTVIASTASPFKFAGSVLDAIWEGQEPQGGVPEDEAERLRALAELAMTRPPRPLEELFRLPVRFSDSCARGQMEDTIARVLGI